MTAGGRRHPCPQAAHWPSESCLPLLLSLALPGDRVSPPRQDRGSASVTARLYPVPPASGRALRLAQPAPPRHRVTGLPAVFGRAGP